jgi:hypothetical protein
LVSQLLAGTQRAPEIVAAGWVGAFLAVDPPPEESGRLAGEDVPPVVIWAAPAPAGSASVTAAANARYQNRLFARVLSMR